MDWQALLLSLRLAALTTGILVLLGTPLAYYLSHREGVFFHFLESLISIPLVLPPTVLGFYLLLGLSQIHLAFTFWGLLVGSLIYSLPFALQPFIASFQNIDKNLIEASWLLGESSSSTFLRVSLPLASPGILSGAILCFAHTLGEFGVVLMIGGNIPGLTKTLSIAVYDHVEALEYGAANQTAGVLLAMSVMTLFLASFLRKKTRVST